jgi:hypothetical protein
MLRAFDRLMPPILDGALADGVLRDHVRGALRVWSVKGGHIIAAYAAMAGLPHPTDLSVLAGSFGRLYDDLLDEARRPGITDRLDALLQGRAFVPADDLEGLLATLYAAIAERLARPQDDPVHAVLRRLHYYQVRSRPYRGHLMSDAELHEVTARKGALSLTLLCCLVRPDMPVEEQLVIGGLGATLQLIDDYQDFDIDRRRGITTPATRCRIGVLDLSRRILAAEPEFRRLYGARAARPFLDELWLFLPIAFMARHRPCGRPGRPGRSRCPLWLLVRRGHSPLALESTDD